MKSYTLHVLVDTEEKEDVFRDIKISENATLEKLHSAILKAFSFKGEEMAAFYQCDKDWERGKEFPQMAMDKGQDPYTFANAKVKDLVSKKGAKALYLYDFLKMWAFLIEVINVSEEEKASPAKVLLSVGAAPKENSKKVADGPSFKGEGGMDDFDFNEDDDDEYDDSQYESYDDDSYY